jgi:hypothetical protein
MRVPAYSADRAAPPVRRDRLRRVYLSLRFLAYGLGLAGAALAYFGRMAEPALQKKLFGVGAGLMITMFLIFLVSHGLYLFMKFGASPRS